MGVSDLRDAFNSVAEPAFTCHKATLGYLRANDSEWQILTFNGIGADGTPFEARSDRLRASDDILSSARAVAASLIANKEAKP